MDEQIRELEPFTFFAGYRSAIRPLGGEVMGPDPKYGFHTEYHEFRPGPVRFRVTIHDLKVSFGELGIHLNAYVPGAGNNASLATATAFSMTELQERGGAFEVQVYAVRGVTYAVYGYFLQGTDAVASGLTVTVEELGVIEEADVPTEAFEPTCFGSTDVDWPTRLIDDDAAPAFAHPVSQLLTVNQLEEPSFTAIGGTLGRAGEEVAVIWRKAFVLQVLERYGFRQNGARGLRLGDRDMDLTSFFATNGNPVVLAGDAADLAGVVAVESASNPYLSHREIDFNDVPKDLRGFDFLWSIGTANRMFNPAIASLFIESAMRCLRPGGLAVHIIDLSMNQGTGPSSANRPMGREDVTRIAVTMLSRSHDVAQLNFGGSGDRTGDVEGMPFGLIIRKGRM